MYPLKIGLPKGFLNEEIRSNFVISEFRKKIWAIELDLTSELLRVCHKYGLKVFAAYGTLLGAVRHEGFIPWDDDMDFFMLRDDYDELLRVAHDEFREPYFMQTALSDRQFFNGYARLRKSDTTGAVSFTDSPDFNNGIFIDIFVLDGMHNNPKIVEKQKRKTLLLSYLLFSYNARVKYLITWKQKLLYPICKPFLRLAISYEKLFMIYERNLKRYNNSPSMVACLCVPEFYAKPLPKDFFDSIEYRNYEFLRMPISPKSEELLTILYGDYMKLPPENERGNWHKNIIVFNPDIPYKEYYQKRSRGTKTL